MAEASPRTERRFAVTFPMQLVVPVTTNDAPVAENEARGFAVGGLGLSLLVNGTDHLAFEAQAVTIVLASSVEFGARWYPTDAAFSPYVAARAVYRFEGYPGYCTDNEGDEDSCPDRYLSPAIAIGVEWVSSGGFVLSAAMQAVYGFQTNHQGYSLDNDGALSPVVFNNDGLALGGSFAIGFRL